MDKSAVTELIQDGSKFVRRCTKPDLEEYLKIVRAVGAGFLMMGAIGYVVKLVHIPIRHLITLVRATLSLDGQQLWSRVKLDAGSWDYLMADTEVEVQKDPGNNAATQFLNDIRGAPVVVKLGSGIEYHGILQAVDGFMNVTLKNTKEVYKGQQVADYGDVFLRGTLVTYISSV